MTTTRELECQIVPLGGDRYLVRVKPRELELPFDIQLVVDPDGDAPLYVPRLPQMPGPIAVFVVTLADLPQLRLEIEFADASRVRLRGATTVLRRSPPARAATPAAVPSGESEPVQRQPPVTATARSAPARQRDGAREVIRSPPAAPPRRAASPDPPAHAADENADGATGKDATPALDAEPSAPQSTVGLWQRPQLVDTLLLVVPALLIVVLSFSSGGSLPGATALTTLVLGVLLVVRVALRAPTLAMPSRARLACGGAIVLLVGWVLLSSAWSHALARAILDYDRVLLYLFAFLLLGLGGRRSGDLRLLVRAIAVAAVVVCLCALITRLLPDVWPIAPSADADRLNYPLGYWNALGLLSAIGFVLCLALTSDARESRLVQALSAAALPVLGTTLLLTFSRGSIAVCLLGTLAMLLVGRPRAALSGLAVAVPTVGIAVAVAYSADLLASSHPTSSAAASQGLGVAVVVVLCIAFAAAGRLALVRYDDPAFARRLAARIPRSPIAAGALAVGVLLIALAIGVPGEIDHQYHDFINDTGRSGQDQRGRLTSAGNNGRAELWKVALAAFSDEPLHGYGASTFGLQLDHRGTGEIKVEDAHSLYLESLAELGIVGFLLVCGVLALVLGAFFKAARGPDRALGGALFGAGLAWALEAGLDYMWEYPAITLWLFAAGGLALTARRAATAPRPVRSAVSRRRHVVLAGGVGLACLGLLVLPWRAYRSDGPLRGAQRAFASHDCPSTISDAQRAIAALPARPEPYVLMGYCQAMMHQPQLALSAMKQAVKRDPDNWTTHFGLAIARASAGLDPRPRMILALHLRPRDQRHVPGLQRFASDALRRFASNDPAVWRERALEGSLPTAPPQL
ncbi:MAG TPA: O-antigen ligase family protein [Solirubrobacteraceae bacterium]|nr:O-antigen ligase family protein [Solirubrobacteraceae bacterium]